MGLGSIQFGGLASGLDTNTIIRTLVSLERRPIQILEGQRSTNQSKITLLGSLEGLVKDLQAKAEELLGGNGSNFFSNLVSSTDESVAEASVTGDVQAGNYAVSVVGLAERDRYAFQPVADADAVLPGAVGFRIEYDGQTYEAGGTDLSLNQIASEINSTMGDAVTASVINAGTEASPAFQLVIAANDTGEDYALGFPEVILPTGLTPMDDPGTGTPGRMTVARNAEITINGLTVERSTNEFAGVIPGMTFNVRNLGDVSFNVEVDAAGTEETVKELVEAYNKVVDFLNKQSDYDPESGPGGELFGENVLSSVRSALNSALFDVDIATVQADTAGFSTLSLVGVELESDGRLKLDSAKFREKYEQDSAALADLFSGDGGVLERLDAAIDGLVKGPVDENGDPFTYGTDGIAVPGVFDQRKTVLDSINDRINDDVERLERNVESFENSLILKYANLEKLMSGLNAQSSYFNSINSQLSQG